MQAGVHEKAAPADTMARFPGARWAREFITSKRDDRTLPASTTAAQLIALVLAEAQPALDAGGKAMVSLKLRPDDVAAGRWDKKLTALGKALLGLDVIVIPWHEPENNHTARVFAPCFARIRHALKAANPDLVVALCSMSYQWRPGAMTAAEMKAWAAIVADLYLVDVYSGESFPAGVILPEHPGFIRWHSCMIAPFPGRRWGVAERGIIAGPTRPATFAREAEWLVTDPVGQTCEVVVVWATGGTEGNPGWLLDDAPSIAAVAAYIARITQPRGYAPSPVDGVLVHLPTGLLVAADRTGPFETFLKEAR